MIARLLLHFWTPQELPDRARQGMAEDWVADLAEFSPQTVAAACADWRRTQSKRPTIAEIRKLCADRRELAMLPRFPAKGITDAEARLIADKWAQGDGYRDIEHYCDEMWEGNGAWIGNRFYFAGRKRYQPQLVAPSGSRLVLRERPRQFGKSVSTLDDEADDFTSDGDGDRVSAGGPSAERALRNG